MPNGDPVSLPRNGNKRPQDNAQAGKESPTDRTSNGAHRARSHSWGREGGAVECSPRRDKMAPAKPLQKGRGWEQRQKSDTRTWTHAAAGSPAK